jgi:predicted thioredoxin/glutaredoxin
VQVFDVYSRRGCHLCEVLLEQLFEIAGSRARICVHDVDTHEDWLKQYGARVPVVLFRGEVLCHYRLDVEAVSRALAGKE